MINQNVSIIVKTFKRPECIKKFIQSVREFYPDIMIYVADDSTITTVNKLKTNHKYGDNIEYWLLPYYVGVSKGRNFLLDRVKTKYFITCDDDFIFNNNTDLNYFYQKIQENTADIIGGKIVGRNAVDYNFSLELVDGVLYYIKKPRYTINDLLFYDVIPQFFIANTEIIRNIRWRDELKTVEHSDFFIRCFNAGIRTAFTDKVEMIHEHIKPKNDYEKLRYNNKFTELFKQFNNIKDTKRKLSEFPKTVSENFTCGFFKYRALTNIKDVSSLFNRMNINYWWACGTLLGIIRNGDLIPHDTDIDMHMPITELRYDMLEELLTMGFKLVHMFGTYENGLELSFERYGVKLDIFFVYEYDDKSFFVSIWKNKRQLRYKYKNSHRKTKMYNWKGVNIRIPLNCDSFLSQNYGKDWRTPISGKDWDWAFSPSHIILDPYKSKEELKADFYNQPIIENCYTNDKDTILRYIFKVTNGDKNPFDSFDRILIINIDNNIDRWLHIKKVAEEYGFIDKMERLSATVHNVGSFGCAMSHKKALLISKDRGYKRVLVIEDDIDFLYNIEYVYDCLNKALRKDNYDILYLGINPSDRCDNTIKTTDIVGDTFKIDQHIWGTFAIVYQNKGLDVFDNIPDNINDFTIYDREDMILIKSEINKRCVYPPIISVGDFETTTGTGLQTCGKYVKKKSDIAIMRSLYRLGLVDEKNIIREIKHV